VVISHHKCSGRESWGLSRDTLAAIARARAKETGRYLARATNTGISAMVSPGGAVLARSPQFEVDVIEADMVPMEGATPYVKVGNAPAVGIAFVLLLAAVVLRERRGRNERDGK